jgi:hypothetical protein
MSLSKAVKKTLEERRYKMVVMDAPNVRVEDFQDVWATAQVQHCCKQLQVQKVLL